MALGSAALAVSGIAGIAGAGALTLNEGGINGSFEYEVGRDRLITSNDFARFELTSTCSSAALAVDGRTLVRLWAVLLFGTSGKCSSVAGFPLVLRDQNLPRRLDAELALL
jgi:hypothetical protein